MQTIYLSPSTQEFNPYAGGGNEEFYMNLIADAMEPYLAASGIGFMRNTPDMTAASAIAASNSGVYDLHLALHSNATASGNGMRRGIEVYYYPTSGAGKRFADILVQNFKQIYPLANNVSAISTTSLGEVARVKAPGVLIEIGYHDNIEDADWVRNNIDLIAKTIVKALCEYFDIPFNLPEPIRIGSVKTNGGHLNIRTKPMPNAFIVGRIPNGAEVIVFASVPGWYLVQYGTVNGYVAAQYVQLAT